MIVREAGDQLILVDQHAHAAISGNLAQQWAFDPAHPPERRASLRIAAELHDIGWVALDKEPAWNSETGRPYSFLDFPIEQKLPAYKQGVDQVADVDLYAALLCSRHYESFYPESPSLALNRSFVESERSRQHVLKAALLEQDSAQNNANIAFDLALLKLWDNLSLYLCLNTPGAAKDAEHPWYRGGFNPTATRLDGEKIRFQAAWQNSRIIVLNPFPLQSDLSVTLEFRSVTLDNRADRSWPERLGAAGQHRAEFVWVPK